MLDGARTWVNENSTLATGVLVAVLLIALASIVLQGRRPSVDAADVWFYDPTTGKTFTAGADRLPPIESPEGNEAVRAYYFACGECTEANRFLGYYEKYTPETKAELEKHREVMLFSPGHIPGRFFSEDGKKWFEDGSKEARQLVDKAQSKCPNLQSCLPE